MNIVEVLAKYARLTPQAPALVELRPVSGLRQEINWQKLEERTNKLANYLLQTGVKKGDKVFLLGKNSLNWLEIYFGVMKTGAWITPLNFRFTDDDIRFCAKTAEPVTFIFDEEFAERVSALRSDLGTIRQYVCIGKNSNGFETLDQIIDKGSEKAVDAVLNDEDECALYFTSGTTGAPKPVLIQQKSLMCSAISEATNHQLVQSDRFLMMPPMYHVAIAHMLGVVLVGGCSVLLTEMVNPKLIVETVSKERITVAFLLVPWATDMLESFDNRSLKIEEYDMSSWRLTHMGAQPIPPALVKRFKSFFPAMLYDTNFGLSESMGPGIIHLGMENEHKVGAIGKPTLMWDAKIVDENGIEVKQGEVGELVVKGAGVMKEYYKNPELTARTIRNGWLFTGDLGRIDEDGFIYLVDRKKDLIISGGENIYPGEVEEILLKHPKIHDVALIGIPHDRLVEVPAAIVDVLEGESLTEDEVRKYCDENMPRYKRPHKIIFDKVPRNPTGKIEKPKLRAKYAAAN